jgi:hypothetical protein
MIPPSFKRAKLRRIVRLSGDDGPVVVYTRSTKKKKKTTRGLKPAQRMLRQVAQANQVASAEFLGRFDKSKRSKRDGPFRDGPKNTAKALRKASKKIKFTRIF